MLAKIVNDDARILKKHSALRFFASKLAPTKSRKVNPRQQKARSMSGLSVVTWRSAFQVTEYGAADGTRTRDPRRDRPVF